MDDISAFLLLSIWQRISDNGGERLLQQQLAQYKLQQTHQYNVHQQLARRRRQQLKNKNIQQSQTVDGKTSTNHNLKPEQLGLGISLDEQLSKSQRKRRRQAAIKAEQAAEFLKKDKPILNQKNMLKKPAAQLVKTKPILNQENVAGKTSTNAAIKAKQAVELLKKDKPVLNQENMSKKHGAQLLKTKPILNQENVAGKTSTNAAIKAKQAMELLKKDKPVLNKENMSKKLGAQLLETNPILNQKNVAGKTSTNVAIKAKQAVELLKKVKPVLNKENMSKKPGAQLLETNPILNQKNVAKKTSTTATIKAKQAVEFLKKVKPVLNQLENRKIQQLETIAGKSSTNDNLKPEQLGLGISLDEQLSKRQRRRRREAAKKRIGQTVIKAEQAAEFLKKDKPVLNQENMSKKPAAQLLKTVKPILNHEAISKKSATTPVVAKNDLPNSVPKSVQNVTKRGVEKTVALPTTQVSTKDTESNQSINKIAASDMQTVSKIRSRFSLEDSNFAEQMSAIALHFRNEIQLFQQHLLTLHCSTNTDPCLLIAKIFCSYNKSISTETFNLIREEIVGWVGIYQYQGMDTPIFHSITNNGTDVTIVCENLYAYDCLKKSIDEIEKLKFPCLVSIAKMPPISHLLHCYGVIYESIIGDPDLLLTQINLHQPALEANHWIVVSHEVCHEKQETHFILLLDAQSALAITFHYNNKLLICLHQLQFTMRGHVSATVENSQGDI